MGFPGGASGKGPASQCRRCKRCGFDHWVRKIPWKKKWQTHPSILDWRIPWTEEPGELQSRGSAKVRHNLETKPPPPPHEPEQPVFPNTWAGKQIEVVPLMEPQ